VRCRLSRAIWRRIWSTAAFVGRLAVFSGFGFLGAAGATAEETFSGTIVVPRGMAQSINAPITATVQEYTTDEEARRLREILDKQGWDEVVKSLRQANKGSVSLRDATWPVSWARVFPGQNGARRVMIVTLRPISLPEDEAPPPSMDPTFGVIQIDLNAQGKGQGLVIGGARLRLTGEGHIQVESSAPNPRKIINVQMGR